MKRTETLIFEAGIGTLNYHSLGSAASPLGEWVCSRRERKAGAGHACSTYVKKSVIKSRPKAMDTTSWFWPPGIECFNPAVAIQDFPWGHQLQRWGWQLIIWPIFPHNALADLGGA